jgi:RimJ/RimL family protein N-acetyltransferase
MPAVRGSQPGGHAEHSRPGVDWAVATPLTSPRLLLEPLRTEHAEEMAPVLGDAALYRFIGGSPPTVGELRARYAMQVAARSEDGSERWLNWVLRRRESAAAIGFVQATVTQRPEWCADLAWVVGTAEQHHGLATEAALAMVGWLRQCGLSSFVARIHPANAASAALARGLGLTATDRVVAGERVWVAGPRGATRGASGGGLAGGAGSV